MAPLQEPAQRGVSSNRVVVGPGRLELPTLRLSGVRSNHLSYGPIAARSRGARDRASSLDPSGARAREGVAERDTKTAAPRACLVSSNVPVRCVSALEGHP